MLCPDCSTIIPDGVKYCGQCGRSLSSGVDNGATVVLDASSTGSAARPAPMGVTTTREGGTSGGGTWTDGRSMFHIPEGEVFANRYRIERLLGEGGMGAVYKALDLELDRTVALKLVRPELTSPQAMQRFKQELLLASRISHKHILRIHDLSDFGGVKYITMAFVEGQDLADLIDHAGRVPLDAAQIRPPVVRGPGCGARRRGGAPRPEAAEHPGRSVRQSVHPGFWAGQIAGNRSHQDDPHRADHGDAALHVAGAGGSPRSGPPVGPLFAGADPVRNLHRGSALPRRIGDAVDVPADDRASARSAHQVPGPAGLSSAPLS